MKSICMVSLILTLTFPIMGFSAVSICKNELAGLAPGVRGHKNQEGEEISSLIPKEFQKPLSEPLQAFHDAGYIAASEIIGASFYRGSLVGSGLWGYFQERTVVWYIEKRDIKTLGKYSNLFVLAYSPKDNSWHLGYAFITARSKKDPSLINQKDFTGFAPKPGTYVTDSAKTFVIVP